MLEGGVCNAEIRLGRIFCGEVGDTVGREDW